MKEQNFRQEIIDALRATAPEGVLPPSEGNGYKDHTEALRQIINQLDVIAGHLFVISEQQRRAVSILDRIDQNVDDLAGSK